MIRSSRIRARSHGTASADFLFCRKTTDPDNTTDLPPEEEKPEERIPVELVQPEGAAVMPTEDMLEDEDYEGPEKMLVGRLFDRAVEKPDDDFPLFLPRALWRNFISMTALEYEVAPWPID